MHFKISSTFFVGTDNFPHFKYDGFGLAPTKTDCACNAKRVKVDLIAAGFVHNKDKCEWGPSQEMAWLGFQLEFEMWKIVCS
jgi:hypothetical protein